MLLSSVVFLSVIYFSANLVHSINFKYLFQVNAPQKRIDKRSIFKTWPCTSLKMPCLTYPMMISKDKWIDKIEKISRIKQIKAYNKIQEEQMKLWKENHKLYKKIVEDKIKKDNKKELKKFFKLKIKKKKEAKKKKKKIKELSKKIIKLEKEKAKNKKKKKKGCPKKEKECPEEEYSPEDPYEELPEEEPLHEENYYKI